MGSEMCIRDSACLLLLLLFPARCPFSFRRRLLWQSSTAPGMTSTPLLYSLLQHHVHNEFKHGVRRSSEDASRQKNFLYSQGMAVNIHCPKCNVEAEDLQYLILGCTWSVEIWQALESKCGKKLGSLQSNTWREHFALLGEAS